MKLFSKNQLDPAYQKRHRKNHFGHPNPNPKRQQSRNFLPNAADYKMGQYETQFGKEINVHKLNSVTFQICQHRHNQGQINLGLLCVKRPALTKKMQVLGIAGKMPVLS